MNALNEQFSNYEIAILSYMMRNHYNGQDGQIIKNNIDEHLQEIGFNDSLQISIAFTQLKKIEMIWQHPQNDLLFCLTEKGMNWFLENKNNLESKTLSG